MKDPGELAADAIMTATQKRIGEIFRKALIGALKDNAAFLQKIKNVDAGKIKPNRFYNTPAKIAKWRAGFTREAIRQDGVIAKITRRIEQTVPEVKAVLMKSGQDVYRVNRAYVIKAIGQKSGLKVAFNQYDQRQISILLSDTQPLFSKIAYRNLGANRSIVRRLANEMAQATAKGEAQPSIIKRIMAVTGQSEYQAQRVAQTERVRLQSQARNDAGTEAARHGLKITKEWSARMVNTRETHAALDGVKIPQDQPFVTEDGNELMYPGDPNAPAEEVINCHCVMITDVEV